MILDTLLDAEHASVPELLVGRPPAQRRLRDVGPVQAVHAVAPNHPLLLREHLCVPGLLKAHSRWGDRVEVSHRVERRAESVDQDRHTIETHLAALGVEVKVDVVRIVGDGRVRGSCGDHVALKRVFDGKLVTFVIDEIDEVDVAIVRDKLTNVALKGIDLTV
jgi:hypothetical protein